MTQGFPIGARGAGGPSPQASTGGPTPAAVPFKILIDGLEVSQAIQDMAHSVPLVAEKVTWVRAYLSIESQASVEVRGELTANGPAGEEVVYSSGSLVIDPADNGNLLKKRESLGLSLNFPLPEGLTLAGTRTFTLARVDTGTARPAELQGNASRQVEFLTTPPLRVTVLGAVYEKDGSPGTTYEPRQRDVRSIESWLRRAYPVPRVEFEYRTYPSKHKWPFDPDPNDGKRASKINTEVAAIRNADLSGRGTNRRTHYFGLVDDAGHTAFMQGWAAGIPSAPDPSTVASGPTGTPASQFWGWDVDGCYGDWYAGHELAHTFGRAHPGFCNQGNDDPGAPADRQGRISPGDGSFVGLDVGDPSLGIAPAALPGTLWHDLMTYCDRVWPSDYTYKAIRTRLIAEDALASQGPTPQPLIPAPPLVPPGESGQPPGPGASAMAEEPESNAFELDAWAEPADRPVPAQRRLNVIATVNATRGTGSIEFVQPVGPDADRGRAPRDARPELDLPEVAIRAMSAQGQELAVEPVTLRVGSHPGEGQDVIGLVDEVLHVDPGVRAIELLLGGRPVARYGSPTAAPPLGAIANLIPIPRLDERAMDLAWDAPSPPGPAAHYTVQASTDGGETWRTIAIDQPTPKYRVNTSMFRPGQRVRFRVIASDGFDSHTISSEDVVIIPP